MEAGIPTLTTFISPFKKDRETVRNLMPHGDFIEIYCKASLETCEARDVKELYKKVRAGLIQNYTGIDSRYEEPENPELVVDTDKETIEESIQNVLDLLTTRNIMTQ